MVFVTPQMVYTTPRLKELTGMLPTHLLKSYNIIPSWEI